MMHEKVAPPRSNLQEKWGLTPLQEGHRFAAERPTGSVCYLNVRLAWATKYQL